MIIIFIHTVLTIVAFFLYECALGGDESKKIISRLWMHREKMSPYEKKLYILTHRYWPFFVSSRSSTIFRINFLLCVLFSTLVCAYWELYRSILSLLAGLRSFCRVSHCIYSIFMGTVYSFVQRDDSIYEITDFNFYLVFKKLFHIFKNIFLIIFYNLVRLSEYFSNYVNFSNYVRKERSP